MFPGIKNYSQANYVSGKVEVNRIRCTGCKQCTIVCPATALEMSPKRKSRMVQGANCISCGACMAVCGSDAIRIIEFYHVPDGAYQTQGRKREGGKSAFPRDFD